MQGRNEDARCDCADEWASDRQRRSVAPVAEGHASRADSKLCNQPGWADADDDADDGGSHDGGAAGLGAALLGARTGTFGCGARFSRLPEGIECDYTERA